MDDLHKQNTYHRRDRDNRDYRYRRDYGDRDRNRGRYYDNYNSSHRNYYGRRHYDRNPRKERAASPVEGSEEYLSRKIQNTSALIMRHLLTEEAVPSTRKTVQEEACEVPTIKEPPPNKPAPKRATFTAEQVREKIIGHVTKLNEGRRKNFINRKSSSELDDALNLINKQKRLEISEFLRRMNANNASGEGSEVPVMEDMGVEFQDLPLDIIEQLRTLGIDLENFQKDPSELFNIPPESESTTTIQQESTLQPLNLQPKLEYRSEPEPHSSSPTKSTFKRLNPPYRSYLQESTEKPKTSMNLQSSQIAQSQQPVSNLHPKYNNRLFIYSQNRDSPLSPEPESSMESPLTYPTLNRPSTTASTLSQIRDSPLSPEPESSTVQPSLTYQDSPLSPESTVPPIICDTTVTEIKEEPDDEFVEPLRIKDEPHLSDSSDYDRMTIKNDFDPPNEFSAIMAIEATIRTFVDIDRKESQSQFLGYGELIDKIRGFERCTVLLENYKKDLMDDLFYSVRKLDSDRRSFSQDDSQQGAAISDLVINESVPSVSECNVSVSKRNCEEEDDKEVKKAKLEETEEDLGDWREIKEVVCALKTMYCTANGANLLLIGTDAGKLLVANLKTNKIDRIMGTFAGPVTCFEKFRGKHLYVGTASKLLNVYLPKKGILTGSHQLPNGVLCMTSGWAWIFVGCRNGTIVRVRHSTKCIEMEDTSESRLDVLSIKTSQEGPRKILIVGQRRGPVVIRDVESMLYLRNFYDQQEVVLSTVYAMEFANGKLYCGTAQDDILQFECHHAQLRHRLKAAGSKGITCMRIVLNVLFAGCSNGCVYIYKTVEEPELLKVLEGPGGSICAMEVTGKLMVVSTLARKVAQIDIPQEAQDAFCILPKIKKSDPLTPIVTS